MKNCINILIEDTGGLKGFDLQGTIQANGLSPMPAVGVKQLFEPCDCDVVAADKTKTILKTQDEDQKTIKEIVSIAEERRLKKIK